MDLAERLGAYATLVGRIEVLSGYVGEPATDPAATLERIYAVLEEFNAAEEFSEQRYAAGYSDGLSAWSRTRDASPEVPRPRLRLVSGDE